MKTRPLFSLPKNAKVGFWCPEDIASAVKILVEKGVYADQSKALVGLLRAALEERTRFPDELQERIARLGIFLQRNPDIIVRLCVEGILEMVEKEDSRSPLIVEEYRLRKQRETPAIRAS